MIYQTKSITLLLSSQPILTSLCIPAFSRLIACNHFELATQNIVLFPKKSENDEYEYINGVTSAKS